MLEGSPDAPFVYVPGRGNEQIPLAAARRGGRPGTRPAPRTDGGLLPRAGYVVWSSQFSRAADYDSGVAGDVLGKTLSPAGSVHRTRASGGSHGVHDSDHRRRRRELSTRREG